MHVQLGKIINNKIQIDQKPKGISEQPGQKQSTGHDPCIQHHQGGTNHPAHPSGLDPGPAPTLISYAGLAPPPSGASKGTCYLFLLPHESQ